MKAVKIKLKHDSKRYVELIDIIQKQEKIDFTQIESDISYIDYNNDKKNYKKLVESIFISGTNKINLRTNEKYVLILEIDTETSDDVDDKDGIFVSQYLLMLRKIINENQNRLLIDTLIIVFPYIYAQKIASCLVFDYYIDYEQNCESNPIYSYDYVKNNCTNLPTIVTFSSEWIPIIPLYLMDKKAKEYSNSKLLRVLNQTIFSNSQEVSKFFSDLFKEEKNEKINLNNLLNNENQSEGYRNVLKVFIKSYLRKAIRINACKDFIAKLNDNQEIKDRDILFTSQSLTLLMFLISLNKLNWVDLPANMAFEKKKEKIENVFNQCYDYAEILIQLSENVEFYTHGGYLTLRANDNSDSISEIYEIQYNLPIFRMSIIDYVSNKLDQGKKLLIDGIREKSKIADGLKMNHIFDNIIKKDKIKRKYKAYLKKTHNIIHHYGLPTFCKLVAKHGGVFYAISSYKSNLYDDKASEDEYVINCNNEQNNLNKFIKIKDEKKLKDKPHVTGTTYDIILPIQIDNDSKCPLPSVTFNNKIAKETYKVNNNFKNFFNQANITKMINDKEVKKGKDLGEWKQNSVIFIAKRFLKKLKKDYSNQAIYYFDLTNSNFDLRYEIIAKIFMTCIIKMKDKQLFFALGNISEPQLVKFVRQFVMFYDKAGENSSMNNAQIFVLTSDGLARTLIGGKSLKSIYEYNFNEQLNSGVPTRLIDFIKYLSNRQEKFCDDDFVPVAFEDYIKYNDDYCWLPKLSDILNTDIHEKNKLGCKISDMHISLSNDTIHLGEFYEAQILFGNTYWYTKFANYIVDKLLEYTKNNNIKNIVIIGYETYSEVMLRTVESILMNLDDQINFHYVIYEKGKYVTSNKKGEDKLRYYFDLSKLDETYLVAFVVGISTTLSTFYEMANALYNNIGKNKFDNIVEHFKYYSILQIISNSNYSPNSIIKVNEQLKTVKNQKGFIDNYLNTDDKYKTILETKININSEYLLSVKSRWYDTDDNNCQACFPKDSYLNEKPITTVNETSLIPIHMLDGTSKVDKDAEKKYKIDVTKYLYYGHYAREDNHFLYYLDTANLLHDELCNKKSDIYAWFKDVQNKLYGSIFNLNRKIINLIIAPSHFSNQAFVAAVNQNIFNNSAYLIDFETKKEFRHNFELKYGNYNEIIEILKKAEDKQKYRINCFFVDDEIISGRTYHRTKDLLKNLFNSYGQETENNEKMNIEIFEAVIVLADRSSDKSRRYYAEKYFSYVRLNVPSIRSYGDSCPICKKQEEALKLVENSVLNSTDKFWRDKSIKQALLTIDEMEMKSYALRDKKNKQNKIEFLCETNLYEISNLLNDSKNPEEMYLKKIDIIIKSKSDDCEKIDYIIGFIKVMSRPFLSYRKTNKNIFMRFALNIFHIITYSENNGTYDIYKTIFDIVNNLNSNDKIKIAQLYNAVIISLCSFKSNFLVANYKDKNNLEICINKCREYDKIDDNLKSIENLTMALKIYSNASKYHAEKLNHLLEDYLQKDGTYSQDNIIYYALYLETKLDRTKKNFVANFNKDNKLSGTKKYEKLKDVLLELILKKNILQQLDFIVPKSKNNNKFISILSHNEIENVGAINKDFEILENGGIIWVKIDNNFKEFKNEQNLQNLYLKTFLTEKETCSLYLKFVFEGESNILEKLKVVKSVVDERNLFLEILRDDFNNDAVRLSIETENQTKALSMSKAAQHGTIQDIRNKCGISFEILMKNGVISDEDFVELNEVLLYKNDIVHLLTNEFISLLYRKIVAEKLLERKLRIEQRSKMGLFVDTKLGIFKKKKFTLFYNYVFGHDNLDKSIKIKFSFDFENADEYDGIYDLFDDELFHIGNPLEIYLFICVFNAVKIRNDSNKLLNFYVSLENNYLVISNDRINNQNDIDYDIKFAKSCIEKEPWVRTDDNKYANEPSITLWTLGKYCENIQKKYLQKNVGNEVGPPIIITKDKNNHFTMKLWTMKKK